MNQSQQLEAALLWRIARPQDAVQSDNTGLLERLVV